MSKEIVDALNRNTEATNALARLYQRDPYKEFIDGGTLKPDARSNRFIQTLDRRDAELGVEPDGTGITMIFSFATPPKQIEFSAVTKGLLEDHGTPIGGGLPDIIYLASFSNDKSNWTKYHVIPIVSQSFGQSGATLGLDLIPEFRWIRSCHNLSFPLSYMHVKILTTAGDSYIFPITPFYYQTEQTAYPLATYPTISALS